MLKLQPTVPTKLPIITQTTPSPKNRCLSHSGIIPLLVPKAQLCCFTGRPRLNTQDSKVLANVGPKYDLNRHKPSDSYKESTGPIIFIFFFFSDKKGSECLTVLTLPLSQYHGFLWSQDTGCITTRKNASLLSQVIINVTYLYKMWLSLMPSS